MPKQAMEMPKFKNESEEADWWASAAGRNFVKRKAQALRGADSKPAGSKLVRRLNEGKNKRISIELPAADLERARKIAGRKGVGCQALLTALVHQGLLQEARQGKEK
jgi:predicted DNA binding CopG/RHH family protein